MRVKFELEGAGMKSRIASLLAGGGKPHSSRSAGAGPSVLVRAPQPHDGEGGSCQLLVDQEHERGCEHSLQQFGFQTFVESHYSKPPDSLVKKIENVPKTPQGSVFWV